MEEKYASFKTYYSHFILLTFKLNAVLILNLLFNSFLSGVGKYTYDLLQKCIKFWKSLGRHKENS